MKKRTIKLTPEDLKPLYAEKQKAIRRRLAEFRNVQPGEYFYECVYCILTPQSSAVNAAKAVTMLRKRGFSTSAIDPELLLHQKDFYIRFHRTKAKHLLHAKEQFPVIQEQLTNGTSSPELREWLVKNVKGMGWKEASHFLRNIGHRELAILDRHILRNLLRFGVLRSLPKVLTPKLYLSIEQKFKKFSHEAGIPMDELDLLFWSMETGEILK
jgi:N-glycosylase/DNA lyase